MRKNGKNLYELCVRILNHMIDTYFDFCRYLVFLTIRMMFPFTDVNIVGSDHTYNDAKRMKLVEK